MRKLYITTKTINRILEVHQQINQKYKNKNSQDLNLATESLTEFVSDPLILKLDNLIYDLSPIQRQELSALVWLGRGDFGDFDTAFNYAEGFISEFTAQYLASKLLNEYIPNGLSKLHAENIEIENV